MENQMNMNITPPTTPRPQSPPDIKTKYAEYKAKNMAQRTFTINIENNDRAELRLLKAYFLNNCYETKK
jgi:hypothetical protein